MALSPRSIKDFHVFLASPGDVDPERNEVRQFFDDYNKTIARGKGIQFTVIDWENYGLAGVGRPQDLITKQTLEKYKSSLALVIGIMAQRFGTPSGMHDSGTEEEFEWAIKSHLDTGFPEIKWFFRNIKSFTSSSTDPEKIMEDLEQWKKVQAFKERLQKGDSRSGQPAIFAKDYDSVDHFKKVLANDLNQWLGDPDRIWSETACGPMGKSDDAASVGKDISEELVATSSNNQINWLINQYIGTRKLNQADTLLSEQIENYLRTLTTRYGSIELRGIERNGQQVVSLPLEDVYVPLHVNAAHGGSERADSGETYLNGNPSHSISLEKILELGNRLIITGGPGCGKTTVLLHLAWALAESIRSDNIDLAESILLLNNELPLPIFLPLNAFANYLSQVHKTENDRQGTLPAFIAHYLTSQQTGISLPSDFFEKLINLGKPVILLLDGLDEVTNEENRAQIRETIEHLVDATPEIRIVVTCRSAAYTDRTTIGRQFRQLIVSPLQPRHLRALIFAAYQHLYRGNPALAEERSLELLTEIAELEKKRRTGNGIDGRLVSTPLMVRILIVIHFGGRKLPDQRAELYEKAVNDMLMPAHVPDVTIATELSKQVGNKDVHRELIRSLAYVMHSKGEKLGREISEYDLRSELSKAGFAENLVNSLITATRDRGTLLYEQDGHFCFIHIGFQEFLVAEYLAEVVRGEGGVPGMLKFLRNNGIIGESWWREPLLLTAGYLCIRATKNAHTFLEKLASIDYEKLEPGDKINPEVQVAAAELAGRAYCEWQIDNVHLLKVIRNQIAQIVGQKGTKLRFEAGRTLAAIGDPRTEVTTLENLQLCYIPSSNFFMGSPENDELAFDDEKPLQTIDLSEPYFISRYPVTNSQYQFFVDANGYQDPALWLEANDEGFWSEGKFLDRQKPAIYEKPFDSSNHPVIGVTWYEALAFCRWINNFARQNNWIADEFYVTLPTERQWEKAARGGRFIPENPVMANLPDLQHFAEEPNQIPNPIPSRRWSWQLDQINADLANFQETGIRTTSTIGCFPESASPYGCEEMLGNTLEWCLSKFYVDRYKKPDEWEKDEKIDSSGENRVYRGGSWGYDAKSVRCSYRGGNSPHAYGDGIGFRLAVCKKSSTDENQKISNLKERLPK